jgi:signal transduction histidine kinase
MPSLRRSLIVYFMALLALGLGGFAFIADRAVGDALSAREEAMRQLIDRNATDRILETRQKFDLDLLNHAREVARTAGTEYVTQMNLARNRFELYQQLGLITAPTAGGVGGPGNLAELLTQAALSDPLQSANGRVHNPQFWSVARHVYVHEMNLIEKDLIRQIIDDDRPHDFIQINNQQRMIWRSQNMGQLVLPINPRDWGVETEGLRYDTLTRPEVGEVRRVTYATLPYGVPGLMTWRGRRGPPPPPPGPEPGRGGRGERGDRDGPGGPPPGGPPPRPPEGRGDMNEFIPRNFIQIARSTESLNYAVLEIREGAIAQSDLEMRSTAATRGNVRLLLGIGVCVAFVVLVCGGLLLVHTGLSPLRRLSEAVSAVNEKDFRLPVTKEELTMELVPIHDRLTATLDALKRAFEREKEAIADISHELRTPVASLMATMDVALRKPRSAEDYHQTLKDCREITQQLRGLVERVMTLAYLDAGQVTVTTNEFDIADLARTAANVIRPLAESHGLTLTTQLQAPLVVASDAGKLKEILGNFLHNAIEYNKPGGNVSLEVHAEGSDCHLVVSDTGIGMTPDVKAKIFDRFFRADSSRTATGVHAGLGLAIVKEYIAQLGAELKVESEPDVGSTFHLVLKNVLRPANEHEQPDLKHLSYSLRP